MRDQIAFGDTWNLQGYRRTTEGPDIYLVIALNGTLIDTHDYLPGMVSQVSLPFVFQYDRPFRFSSDVGEDWNLYVHSLHDGTVVLGSRKEITPEGVDALFSSTRRASGILFPRRCARPSARSTKRSITRSLTRMESCGGRSEESR